MIQTPTTPQRHRVHAEMRVRSAEEAIRTGRGMEVTFVIEPIDPPGLTQRFQRDLSDRELTAATKLGAQGAEVTLNLPFQGWEDAVIDRALEGLLPPTLPTPTARDPR